jgi:phosphopentomutase
LIYIFGREIKMKRAIIIVLDSVGMGELPDADKYGDTGSNTLGNIAASIEDFGLKNLEMIGLGNIDNVKGYKKVETPTGCYCRMAEKSAGKDTTTGHWEMVGIILDKPFPVFSKGFPQEIIEKFEKSIGTKSIGNIVASGTDILKTLGSQHVKTGYPIVYTSADSVFQIATHEEIVPIDKLYEICSNAREILEGDYAVGRVIARPFTGTEGNFTRTDRRHDFSLNPSGDTILNFAVEKGYKVKGVGKIEDIFNKQGITDSVHIHNNMDGVDKTLEYMEQNFEGIIFTNLVDFDMLFGHRNDIKGYANALIEFDNRMPEILKGLKEEDLLFITADHGCDPTTPSTDHSREYVPLLIYGNNIKKNVNLGTRTTFADLGATVAEYLEIKTPKNGISFLKEIKL